MIHWVMSCRAFSRRIEHHTLASLLRHSGAEMEFRFTPTERNRPLREFLGAIGAGESGRLRAARFREECGELPHRICEVFQ